VDDTQGVLTTQKIQALLDTGFSADVRSRRDLAGALARYGEQISTHGVEAWFRHVDSNYNFKRESLSGTTPSYPIPKRRWAAVIEAFGIQPNDLDLSDVQFRKWCLEQSALRSPSIARPEVSRVPSRHLVARDAEYREFLDTIERATHGTPSILLIEGDAGLGKSRLLAEFNAALDDSDCLRLGASCAEDSEIPLLPIVDLIRLNLQRIAAAEGASVEPFEELQKEYVATRALGQTTPRFFVQFSSLLLEIAQRRTLVITVDDLHWADDATRRFLHYLWQNAESSKGNRLVLIGTLRPGVADSGGASFIDRLRRFDNVKTLRIGPMKLEDLGAVLDTTTDPPVTDRLCKFIWDQSLGNAFYALEILRSLKQEKHLFVRNGRTDTIATPEQLQLHGDVTAIFRERFGSFTEATQLLLSYAAALANNFTLEQVQLLFPKQPLQQLLDSIEESEREGFLAYHNDRFRFTHPIIRQAVYQLASETRRARIHCNIADHLRHDTRSPSEYQDIEVAQHLTKGRMLADAKLLAAYCYKAAQLARKLAAWDQVILFSRTALGVEDADALSETQRADLLTSIGGGLHQSGKPVEALDMLEQAKQRFANFGDHLSYAHVLSEMARIRGNFGMVDPNETDELDEMQRLAAQLGTTHPHTASRLLDSVAARYMYSGEPKRALEFSLKALNAVRHQSACVERALAGISVGLSHLQSLDIDAAESYLNEALDVANATTHMPSAARALQRLSIVHFVRGSLSNVALGTKRIRDVGREIASTGEFTLALAMQLAFHALRAEFTSAESIFDEGMNLSRSSGYVWGKPHLIAAYCYMCHRHGKCDTALAAAEELARGDRRAFERLVAQIRYYATLEGRTGAHAGDYTYLPFDGAPYDVMRSYRYGMDLRIAALRGDAARARVALSAIELAASKGIVLTAGWPFLVSALRAEGLAFLGELEAAHYHFTVATELALRLGLNAEIEPLLTLSSSLGFVDDHAQRALRLRRNELSERFPQVAAGAS
jgi:tetratricopeptide (TPR) repeat protein